MAIEFGFVSNVDGLFGAVYHVLLLQHVFM